jgi:hypothetical protein
MQIGIYNLALTRVYGTNWEQDGARLHAAFFMPSRPEMSDQQRAQLAADMNGQADFAEFIYGGMEVSIGLATAIPAGGASLSAMRAGSGGSVLRAMGPSNLPISLEAAAMRARTLGNIAETRLATQGIGRGLATMEARAAEQIAAESIATKQPTGQFYSVAFETKLVSTSYPGFSRATHFQKANAALLSAMEVDASFASTMRQLGITLERTATGLAPRTSPSGWTWHHAFEPGTMQLVPRIQHTPGSIFQKVLHPRGVGGYSKWGMR